jgi:prepilin-type N-terminal cleavage/methylation domain-containing protein
MLMATRVSSSRGSTLIELLVVIGIIGILVALIIPAVQAAREASRRAQCRNNLRQMALGANNNHSSAHKFFPSGGWGWGWAGDPNYGYGEMQPGGWMYNILPYIEESALHDLGKGLMPEDSAPRRAAIQQAIQTVVPLYFCPTRRPANALPFVHHQNYFNLGTTHRPQVVGRNDYAACAGDRFGECKGPSRYADWNVYSCWDEAPNNNMNGITGLRNTGPIQIKRIPDGLAKTILYGEKTLRVSTYETADHDNDQGWNLGFDSDVGRFCIDPPSQDALVHPLSHYWTFGSAHPDGMHCAMADGSVHTIAYDIDRETFRRLGVRNDGLPVQAP